MRGAHSVCGDIGAASIGNQSLVLERIRGQVRAAIGEDNLLQLRELRAKLLQLPHLREAGSKHDFGSTMFQNVSDAFRRFVEIDGNGNSARARDGKIGRVPLRTVGCEKSDAIPRLHSQLDKCGGESRNTPQHLFGGDLFPAIGSADQLRAEVRQ